MCTGVAPPLSTLPAHRASRLAPRPLGDARPTRRPMLVTTPRKPCTRPAPNDASPAQEDSTTFAQERPLDDTPSALRSQAPLARSRRRALPKRAHRVRAVCSTLSLTAIWREARLCRYPHTTAAASARRRRLAARACRLVSTSRGVRRASVLARAYRSRRSCLAVLRPPRATPYRHRYTQPSRAPPRRTSRQQSRVSPTVATHGRVTHSMRTNEMYYVWCAYSRN